MVTSELVVFWLAPDQFEAVFEAGVGSVVTRVVLVVREALGAKFSVVLIADLTSGFL